MFLNRKVTSGIGVILLAGGSLFSAGQDQAIDNLIEELVKKRSEVDSLSTELSLRKTELRSELTSLATQKSDLERQIKVEETRLAKIEHDMKKLKDTIDSKSVSRDELKPVLLETIEEVKGHIQSSLPFKAIERIAELDKIRDMMKDGSLLPEKALARLWSLVEAEFRLTKENGLYQQTIMIDGDNHLADVVKLGMTLMYFKLSDGRVGATKLTDRGWAYTVSTDKEEQQKVKTLFDAFTKQIRTGHFVLPNR